MNRPVTRATVKDALDHPRDGFRDMADDPRASYERHPVEDIEPLENQNEYERLGECLGEMLFWASGIQVDPLPQGGGKKFYFEGGQVRIVVLTYALRPDVFGNLNMAQLSDMLGISKAAFSKHLRKVRERLKFQSRVMRTDTARRNQRQAMLRSHALRRGERAPDSFLPGRN